MFKHLLVPLDGSQLAERALPPALALAERFNSQITLLSVTRVPYMAFDVTGYSFSSADLNLQEEMQQEALLYLRDKQAALQAQGYSVTIESVEGEPVAEIVLDVAKQRGVDTIVMSTHGRGGVSRWVFGSVADKVLQQAEVPVLLVRVAAEEDGRAA